MNKVVLMSIQPEWCELIANGKKTVEVRKTKPKLETPFKVYIYCTKGKLALLRDDTDTEKYKYEVWRYAEFHKSWGTKILGCKVIGEFICDEITEIHYNEALGGYSVAQQHPVCDFFAESTCLNYKELHSYLKGSDGYGWHISNLVIYDKPKELSEFYRACEKAECDDCPYLHFENTPNSYEGWCGCDEKIPIVRPPQSWCYVESA